MDKLVSQEHLAKMETPAQKDPMDNQENEENQDTPALVVMKVDVERLEPKEKMVPLVQLDLEDPQEPPD